MGGCNECISSKRKGQETCIKKNLSKCENDCTGKNGMLTSKCTACFEKRCPGYRAIGDCAQCASKYVTDKMSEKEGELIMWKHCTSCGSRVPVPHPKPHKTKKKKRWLIYVGIAVIVFILFILIGSAIVRRRSHQNLIA